MAIILNLFQWQAHEERDDEAVFDHRPWWVNPRIWTDRHLASTVSRPTEDAALRFLEDESRAIRHRHRYASLLTPEEYKLLHLERECLRRNVALKYPLERAAWIAAQIGGEWNARGVKLALEEISQVIVEAERDHVAEVVRQWDARVLERRERERAARIQIAAAA